MNFHLPKLDFYDKILMLLCISANYVCWLYAGLNQNTKGIAYYCESISVSYMGNCSVVISNFVSVHPAGIVYIQRALAFREKSHICIFRNHFGYSDDTPRDTVLYGI